MTRWRVSAVWFEALRMRISAQPWMGPAALAVAALLVVAVLTHADPYAADSLLPGCPFHALTGLFCPGCGATRAVHALIHGNPLLALRMNLLATLAIPLLPLMLLRSLRGPGPATVWLTDARPWAALVLGFTLLRNLPLMPFLLLAPLPH
ncbi:MAG: DUF2752 domain-containing protein [Dokdonella sp.]|nr:MAG: DUF2752 domain-containing protein [Gammaproteobacteria bacterium]TXI74886.1 MAG: DUF2752 domain-containing protein [Dokdonella sp.]